MPMVATRCMQLLRDTSLHKAARPLSTPDMVLCSDLVHDSTTSTSTTTTHSESLLFHDHKDKMASQFESVIGHAYSSSHKVLEEPLVRCLACKDSQWEGNYQDLISHFKQCHPLSICWAGDKKRTFTVKDMTKDSYVVELVVAYGNLFWLHVKNDLDTNHLFSACQHIIVKNNDPHTRFMIRTELCDAAGMNCISCSTETRPHTEDISKIFSNQTCAARSHNRLQSFINPDNSLSFTVNINQLYYYQ